MAKQQFFFRLIPPRSTFPFDITAEERALMTEHAVYCRSAFDAGTVLAYGPVLDPAGAFGIALLEVEDIAEAEHFASNDPSVLGGLNRYSIAPMRISGSQSSRSA
jgi:hypothetical protein